MDKYRSLFLRVEQGPRTGETIDCTSKRKLNIGRVVKGNHFVIKEDGVSQKHLLIELNQAKKWTVADLDTSNGTILNNTKLLPHKPRILKDGDLIKFGAETIIRVLSNLNHSPSPKPSCSPNSNPSASSKPRPEPNPSPNPPPQSVVGSTDQAAGQEMTLTQWFDQMEDWMPKHLNDVAQNIISQMRARSREFDTHLIGQYS